MITMEEIYDVINLNDVISNAWVWASLQTIEYCSKIDVEKDVRIQQQIHC